MRKSSVDWPHVPLGEVFEERTEIPNPSDIELGVIPIISKIRFDTGKIELRDVGKTRTKMILIRPGDLVLSGINAAKGAIAICEEKIPISATIHYSSYKPKSDKVNILFLWYFLRSEVFRDILKDNVPGGIKTELKPKRFLPIKIPLPFLEEQCRIMTRIEKLMAQIEEANKLRQETTKEVPNILTSVLNKIFKDDGWEKDSIRNLINNIKTGMTPPSERLEYFGNEINWFTPSDFKGQMYLTNSVRKLSQLAIKENKVKLFKENSILFVGIGATLGKVGILKKPASSNQQITSILFKSKILPEFAYYYFIKTYSQIRQLCPATTLPIFNQNKIQDLEFKYPESLNEQKRIVSYLDNLQAKIDRLKQLQQATQTELDALMPSILSKAFKGEL